VILEQNPSLPVLFDVGGITYPESDFATGDETVYPMSTTDSTNPDDFTLVETGAVVSYLAGNVLQVEVDATTGAASTGFIPLTVAAHRPSGIYASWATLTQGSGSTSASAALTAGDGDPLPLAAIKLSGIATSPALPTTGRWRLTNVDFTLDSTDLQDDPITM